MKLIPVEELDFPKKCLVLHRGVIYSISFMKYSNSEYQILIPDPFKELTLEEMEVIVKQMK